MKAIQNRLRTAYANVCHLCESDRNASEWIERAYREAWDGEKRHRKHSPTSYKLPVSDAACYFAVKWFLDDPKAPRDYREACRRRPDCLYAYGARDSLGTEKYGQWVQLREDFKDVLALDYLKEFCR